ncbi:MAG TPA: DEAD/DEAH box helicase family protein, partial [Melioribacteraceae bacterium]|nr:DEAD/DEAH box helicase family protein [Melioribacteraceae bacterium]
MFVKVVFPLPFRNSFTYSVPEDFVDLIGIGVRVVVPFGKRVLTGFRIDVIDKADTDVIIKPIIDIIDELPVFDKLSLKFYEWISEYYFCSLGEALRYSVPPGSEIESNRIIISDCELCNKLLLEEKNKGSLKFKLLNILALKEKVNLSFIKKAVNKNNIYSSLKSLEKLGAIEITDIIDEARVKPKKAKFVEIVASIDRVYGTIAEEEKRSPKQVIVLLELLSLKGKSIKLSNLLEKTNSSSATINALESKKLIRVFDKEVERVYDEIYKEKITEFELSAQQKEVVESVTQSINSATFSSFLLHGVTGSGKTQVYIELAKRTLKHKKT